MSQRSVETKRTQVLAQDFMTALATVTLKEKDEIETKFDKALKTIRSNLQGDCLRKPYCQRCLEDIKDQLEGQCIIRMYGVEIFT